jgi:hypothetical protein
LVGGQFHGNCDNTIRTTDDDSNDLGYSEKQDRFDLYLLLPLSRYSGRGARRFHARADFGVTMMLFGMVGQS